MCRPPLEAPTGRFLEIVHLQHALRERPQRMVDSIVDTALDRVHPADSIGTVTRLLATYNLTALPVLDEAGRLVGAVSVDDVLDHLMPDDWREADDKITDEMIERSVNGTSLRRSPPRPWRPSSTPAAAPCCSAHEKPEENQTEQQKPRFNNPYSNGPETWR